MALRGDDKWYCKVHHYENERVLSRRIYSIAIQATDGRLYHLTDQKLPDSISLFTGVSHSGKHTAEVLMNPKPQDDRWDFKDEWPNGRDVFHVFLGAFLMFAVRLSVELLKLALVN